MKKNIVILSVVFLIALLICSYIVYGAGLFDFLNSGVKSGQDVGSKIGGWLQNQFERLPFAEKGQEDFTEVFGKNKGIIKPEEVAKNLKPLPDSDKIVKDVQGKKPEELKAPDSDISKLCTLTVNGDFVIGKADIPTAENWIFACDNKFCKDDQAPCKQNPCPKEGSGICGTGCCNDVYRGQYSQEKSNETISAISSCIALPDYGEEKQAEPVDMMTECCKVVEWNMENDIKVINGEQETYDSPVGYFVGNKYKIQTKYDDKIKDSCKSGYDDCKKGCEDKAKELTAKIAACNTDQNPEWCKKVIKTYVWLYAEKVNQETCTPKAKECKDSCLAANQKCRAGEQSCQRIAKEKTKEFLTKLPNDKKIVELVPKSEASSCYDKEQGINRHSIDILRAHSLNEWQKYDLINNQHPKLDGTKGFIDDIELKYGGIPSYSENYLIGNRPLTPEVMADRIIGGGLANPLSEVALNAKGEGWSNEASYGSPEVEKAILRSSDKDGKGVLDYYSKSIHDVPVALKKAMDEHATRLPAKAPEPEKSKPKNIGEKILDFFETRGTSGK